MGVELETILTIVGAMGGIEGAKWALRAWVNRKTDARKEDAAADALEIDNEKNQVTWLEDRIAQRDSKIDTLYIDLRKAENEKLQIVYEKHALELELKEANYNKCSIYDCQERKPPRGTALKNEGKNESTN